MKGKSLLLSLMVVLVGVLFSWQVPAQTETGAPDGFYEKARANQNTQTIDPADVFKARQQLSQIRQTKALGLIGLKWVLTIMVEILQQCLLITRMLQAKPFLWGLLPAAYGKQPTAV